MCWFIMITNVTPTSYFMQKIAYPGIRNSTDSGASFGYDVAISNAFCVIGARYDDPSGYSSGGAAYIYKYDSIENEWDHSPTLYPTGIDTNAKCGVGVAIFENSMII